MLPWDTFKLLEIGLSFLRLASSSSQDWARATFNLGIICFYHWGSTYPRILFSASCFHPGWWKQLFTALCRHSVFFFFCLFFSSFSFLPLSSFLPQVYSSILSQRLEGTLSIFFELFACTVPSSLASCHANPSQLDLSQLQTLLLQFGGTTRLHLFPPHWTLICKLCRK